MLAVKINGKSVKRITLNGDLWWESTNVSEKWYIEDKLVSEIQSRFIDSIEQSEVRK